jgi:hypothetical protein
MAQIGNYLYLPKLHDKGVKINYGEHTRNSIFERQLQHIPEEVLFCKKCVISNPKANKRDIHSRWLIKPTGD